MVAALGVDHGQESSIKVVPGAIWTQRFLLSIYKADLGSDPLLRLRPIALALGMPQRLLSTLAVDLVHARFIHLGYERAASHTTCKFYLEFPSGFNESQESSSVTSSGHGWLVHKAMKWSVEQPDRCTIARYRGAPGLSRQRVVATIENAYGDRKGTVAADFPLQLLAMAETRMDVRDIFILEVEEEGNPRYSFDLNLYDAAMTLADIAPLLTPSWGYFGVPPDEVVRVLGPLSHEDLGHVSGGIDRAGREFCSIYFGAKPA